MRDDDESDSDEDVDDGIDERIDDRELPDESDMDDFDEPSLDSCPYCRKLINEDSEQCPHCGQYISQEDSSRHLPGWMIAGMILLAISFVVWMLISGKWL